MNVKATGLLGASAVLAALAYLNWPQASDTPENSTAVSPPKTESTLTALHTPQAEAPNAPPSGPTRKWDSDEQRDTFFATDMQTRFAPVIHIKHARIRFLEQLISYLKAHYPDDWQQRVEAMLAASFPELAADLLNNFDSLQRYNEWLLADRKALQTMTPEERRRALWDKRYAAFGEEAEEIWAAELRNQTIADTLATVDADTGTSLNDKLQILVSAVEKSYGDRSEHFLQTRQTELLNKFVELPSVQSELRALPASERRSQMRDLRAALGMSAPALDRWEQLDYQRDNAWQRGTHYMAEREEILQRYSGNQAEKHLLALQQQTFGDEAAMIQREEAAGFYRYAGERQIGRE